VDPGGFSLDNWESSIRHLVNVHPRYEDIERKTRIEKADIIYVDTEEKLLDWLLQQNPIGLVDWLRRPTETPRKYFIEVKTTTKGRDEVFHMSRAQYKRVSNGSLVCISETEIVDNVYRCTVCASSQIKRRRMCILSSGFTICCRIRLA
jgi:hypothetical protein